MESNCYILPLERLESENYPEDLTNELIDLFFEYQNPWCQIVDEKLFRQSMKTKGRYYSPCLLNCILALGSRYTDRIDVRLRPEDQNSAGKPFLQKAEVLLHKDMKRPSITTIQSMSILVGVYVVSYLTHRLHHWMLMTDSHMVAMLPVGYIKGWQIAWLSTWALMLTLHLWLAQISFLPKKLNFGGRCTGHCTAMTSSRPFTRVVFATSWCVQSSFQMRHPAHMS